MILIELALLSLCSVDNVEDRIREHTLTSKVLEEERVVRVALPRGYDGNKDRYPVLYVLDGSFNLDLTRDVVDNLAAFATVPDMIVVAVHNTTREWDMTPPAMKLTNLRGKTGRANRFLDFFADELLPLIDEEYRTEGLRILVGHSHGGIFNSYALIARPELFRWHVLLDTPLHLADFWLQKQLVETLPAKLDYEKRLVVVEESFTTTDAEWAQLSAAASPSFRVARIQNLNETHESVAFLGTILALKELFGDYVEPRRRRMKPDELTAYFRELSRLYGYQVEIPATYLSGGNMWDPLAEPEVRELVELPPLQLVDGKDFVGVWRGTSFHAGGVPVDLTLTLEVRGETIVGSTRASIRGRDFGSRDHDFTRVLDGETLEWGHLNERGPGIEVTSVTLQADGTLVGVQDMRGIPEGYLPEDFVMPVTHVTLERVP